jgi:hypothetical protein
MPLSLIDEPLPAVAAMTPTLSAAAAADAMVTSMERRMETPFCRDRA